MVPSPPIIKIQNISFAYNPNDWIFQDVNITINANEIIGIIGSSGSGKTTLAYLLKGIIPHSIRGILKGDVFIGSQNVRQNSIASLAKTVGMVFQDLNAQLFSSTVIEEVEFGLQNLHLNLQWAQDTLEMMNIKSLANKIPMNLSAGQKQRVVLASIIAMHPQILILDEPSAHLDRVSKIRLIETLKLLKTEYQSTILIIDQDPWIIGELSDTLLYINQKMVTKVSKDSVLEKTSQWSWKF
jgi:energy-coupling factor transport system ATP-binding protein